MFISTIQELSFHRENGVTLKWRTRFLLCVDQCSKDSILLMCIECIQALYPYGNSWVVGKALWHIKTKHHQDFHPDDAWFVFSNPVRQMPYINHFRGLLFYDHPSNCQSRFFYRLRASNLGLKLFSVIFRQQLLIMRQNFTDVYCRMWNSNYQGFDGCLPCVYHFKNFEENHHRQAISYQNIPILYQFFLEFFGIDNSGFMTNWWIFSTQIKLHSFAIHFIVGYMHKKRKFRC